MKTAIYGGAFNPPHNGHIHLALSINDIYDFDRIILIPTGNPVHKSDNEFVSDADRLNMCELIADDNSIFEVSDIEIKSNEKSYTYNTVQKLKEKYPKDEFYLIIGGDMLMIFDKWYEYKKLSEEVTVICAAREDDYNILDKKRKELEKDNCVVYLENIKPKVVSSSEIRKKLRLNKSVKNLLPDSVYRYILERKLYEKAID